MHNNFKYFILIIFFLSYYTKESFSQKTVFHEILNKTDYPFLLYLPKETEQGETMPVILFLHGRSLSGNNLNLVKKYGIIDAIERGRKIPAIVVAPQVKKSESWEPDKILDVLNFVEQNYKTDKTRVYVAGMSLGGYGTLHFAGKYPERIAAAVSLCGGGNVEDACNLAQTNLWIQHGQIDKAVKISESQKIYDAIVSCKNRKGDCFLTIYPGAGHGDLADEFYKDTLYNWLFKYKIDTNILANKVKFKETISDTLINKTNTNLVNFDSSYINSPKTIKPVTEELFYTVYKGDTLYSIARKHSTTVKQLLVLNNINENSILQIGQKIRVK